MLLPASAEVADRTLPMRFELRLQGPADACGDSCKLWISATGAITADTPRDFEMFARGHDLSGATVVLDSDGGSVHGAIELGREIRRFGLDTTVGRIVDIPSGQERPRGRYVPQRRLRIDVRLRAARRRAPHGAAGSARDGAPDLARRPPRRSDRGKLQRRGPRAGAARYRPAGEIHHRDGRLDRTARSGVAHPAVGADACLDGGRDAPHAPRDRCIVACRRGARPSLRRRSSSGRFRA